MNPPQKLVSRQMISQSYAILLAADKLIGKDLNFKYIDISQSSI